MNNSEILFASLVGSGMVKTANRVSVAENQLGKHVLPSIPLPVNNMKQQLSNGSIPSFDPDTLWKADAPLSEDQQFFPLSFSIDNGNSYWLFPYEPMISINGKNKIIRRSVAKFKKTEGGDQPFGSVKEHWSQDDYEITITGILFGSLMQGRMEDCFPRDDFQKLRDLFTYNKEIRVKCEPLQLLGISKIVIEDFSFPFTKGENVQAYEIKAYSDTSHKLLIAGNNV